MLGPFDRLRPFDKLTMLGPFDRLRANGSWCRITRTHPTPFGLSLSKPFVLIHRPFDRLRANGNGCCTARSHPTPFGLSLSKPLPRAHRPFDKLRANGGHAVARQFADPRPVAGDQRLLFLPSPPLDPPLRRQRLVPRRGFLRPHQPHRPALVGVARQFARLVFGDARLELVRMPDVVRPVGALQHVDVERFQDRRAWESARQHGAQPSALRICSSTSFALAGIGVPGP